MNKLLGFLGIIKRSGKLSLGFDACIDCIVSKKSKLILISNEISLNSRENIEFKAKQNEIEVIIINISISELEKIFHKKVGIMSINDLNMSKKIHSYKEIYNL